MDDKELKAYCLEVAAKSYCENRKVGAILVDSTGEVIGEGFNYSRDGLPCEDAQGATESHVVHAEDACIANYHERYRNYSIDKVPTATTMYITHNPCQNCLSLIKQNLSSVKIILVESFMKFDSDKVRYDLIPTEWGHGDAQILTFGAKKYKPNNWREVDDIGRYIGALERHLYEFKKAIELGDPKLLFDKDSGLHHMKHLRTNAGFLLTLTEDFDEFHECRQNGLFKHLEFK